VKSRNQEGDIAGIAFPPQNATKTMANAAMHGVADRCMVIRFTTKKSIMQPWGNSVGVEVGLQGRRPKFVCMSSPSFVPRGFFSA